MVEGMPHAFQDTAASQSRTATIEAHGPGFMIRRLQQVSVSFFHDELRPLNLTPLQATVLRILALEDGLDQVSLATRAVVDTSTIKDVVQRLEQHSAVTRVRSESDKRMQLVHLTEQGHALLLRSLPLAQSAASQLLSPLTSPERAELLRLVTKLVQAHKPESQQGGRVTWRRKNTAIKKISK